MLQLKVLVNGATKLFYTPPNGHEELGDENQTIKTFSGSSK